MIPRRTAAVILALVVAVASTPAFAESAAEFVERLSVDPDPDRVPHAPNQVIVKYKNEGPDAVGECVESLLREGRSFSQATPARADSLDRLHRKFNVVSATALFRRAPVGQEASIAAIGERRQARSAGAASVTPLRSNRVSGVDAPFIDHIYLLKTEGETDVEQLCAEFGRDPSVAYCHPDHRMEASFVPNDAYYGTSGAWGQSYEDLWGLSRIRASDAWDVSRGADVVVAVVDTGLDYAHPDIAGNVWSNPGEIPGNGIDDDANGFIDDEIGWNFASNNNDPRDGSGHGTHVSGTIAAEIDNHIGIAGVAPDSRIMPLKGLADSGGGLLSNLVKAIVYATDEGADVINNSWGNPISLPADAALVDAVRYAHANGVVVVASAGNTGTELGGLDLGHHPAGVPESIAVAATDHLDGKSDFSNFGAGIDVGAPGGDSRDATAGTTAEYNNILSLRSMGTFPGDGRVVNGEYLRLRGTSMATPHVSGLAALLLSLHPEYAVEEVRQAIRFSAADILDPGWDVDSGYGRIDAPAALGVERPVSALITQPFNGEYIAGSVDIRGFADGTASLLGVNLSSYRLELGPGTDPEDWQLILESAVGSPGERSLGEWKIPENLDDGTYTLRLVVTDDVAREFESRVTIEEDSNDPAELPGWPQSVQFALGQLSPMMPLVADIDLDGDQEIFLGPWAWHHDGTRIVNGPYDSFGDHPLDIGLVAGYNGPPAVGDVDGDGRNELVQLLARSDFSAEILVFDEHGQMEPGWPKPIGRQGVILRNAVPILADIDGDDVREIVVANSENNLAVTIIDVYRGDGSVMHSLYTPFVSTNVPAVGDLDGDRLPEILVLGQFGEIAVWNHDGSFSNLFPEIFKIGGEERVLEDQTDITAPTIADVDADGDVEITFADTNGTVRVFEVRRGRELRGWPREVACCDPSIPALADIDRDGDLEVIVGDSAGVVHVWQHDGAYADGWPKVTGGATNTTPAVGDLDGDGSLEIVTISADGNTYAWDARGNDLAEQGWPVHTGEYYGRRFFTSVFGLGASPVITDLEGDGDREVVTFTEKLHVWDLADPVVPPPIGTEWPMYRFDRFNSADQAKAGDADLDGARDGADECADTPNDELVDPAIGCSVSQLCPCEVVAGGTLSSAQKREYLACVLDTAKDFRSERVARRYEIAWMVWKSMKGCLIDPNRSSQRRGWRSRRPSW